MDISELQLKINKNQAVNDLKAVEGQLDKTGEAADGLIDTLKNIGLTVGFGKLLKDSLELNNQFKALDNKFSSIFSGGFDTSMFTELKNELTLSDSALRNILSTTGQFAKGLGQSSQYVKNFSADLTRAAADYAAYQGKTSAADVNEYARKFAKATLGEVGELKDIGIVIDTTSESFKNAVKEMQELTGATEAQAKQMVIQKDLIEQTQIAAGSASQNMYDGWAQLNKLFDQFKEILGEVGSIFSSVFGPILHTLNQILEIPFVKSTAAWVTAIGGVAIGYGALMRVLGKIPPIFSEVSKNITISTEQLKQVKAIESEILPLLKEQLKLREKLSRYHGKMADAYKSGGSGLFESMLSHRDAKVDLANIETNLEPLKEQIKNLGTETLNLIPGIEGVSDEFKTAAKALTGTTIATTAATVAETALASARNGGALASVAESLTKINQRIPNLVGGMANLIKTGKIAPGIFAGLGTGLKACLAPLAAIVGKLAILAAVFVIVHDLIKGLVNVLSGKEFFAGTFSEKVANWLYSNTLEGIENARRTEYIDKLKVDFDNINKVLKDFEEQIREVDFKASLENLGLEEKLQKLQAELERLGGATILAQKALELANLKEEYEKLMKEASNLASPLPEQKADWIPTGGMIGASRKAHVEALERYRMQEELDNQRKANEEARVAILQRIEALQKEYNDTLSRTSELQSQIKQTEEEIQRKQAQLVQLNWKFFDELDKLNTVFGRLKETFSFGYKDGIFQDLSKDNKYFQDAYRIFDLNRHLNQLGEATDVTSLERSKKYLTEIFSLTRDRFKYEVDQLMAQRDAMINNLKAMANIVKEAAGFRSSAQASVEANSMEALELASRRLEGLRSSELSPMIEQQRQVKEIENQILMKQHQAVGVLNKINTQLYDVVKKIGTGSGASAEAINPVNPL